jgi:hypothetical protein
VRVCVFLKPDSLKQFSTFSVSFLPRQKDALLLVVTVKGRCPGPSSTKFDSQSNLKIGPLKIGSPKIGSPTEPEDGAVPGPPPSPDPEHHLDHQSSRADLPGADSQLVDLLAAIYAAKGKAKQSCRVSGTTRDVENVAQRELQPAERSLDPRE